MYSFFKTDSYYNLFIELEFLEKFFKDPTNYQWLTGMDENYSGLKRDPLYGFNFLKSLDKIKITTPNNEIDEFNKMSSEIRHKVLSQISKIPYGKKAKDLYLEKYAIHVERSEKTTEATGVEFDVVYTHGFGENDDIIEIKVKKRDLLNLWISGSDIPDLVKEEKILTKICNYFDITRDLVNLDRTYLGIDIKKTNKDLDLNRLGEELIASKYISHFQLLTFKTLFTGHSIYEPLKWQGSLSDLNKFIKAIHSIEIPENTKPKVEWKLFAQFIVIGNQFVDPENIKGASPAKLDNIQELRPFLTMVKNAISKKKPT